MSSKCIRDTVNKVKSKYQETDPFRLAAAMHIRKCPWEILQLAVKDFA